MQLHASAPSKRCQTTRDGLSTLRDSAAKSLTQSNQPPRRLGSAVDMLHSTLPHIWPPSSLKKSRFRGTGPGTKRCFLTCNGDAGRENADTQNILSSGRCCSGLIFEGRARYGTDRIHFVAVCPHTVHYGYFSKASSSLLVSRFSWQLLCDSL